MDMNDTGNRVIAGVIVVILIIAAWYLGTFRSGMSSTMAEGNTQSTSTASAGTSSSTTTNSTATNSTASTITVESGGAVSVSDQSAGMSVSVNSVTLGQTGWVAVRDSTGRTLGAALVSAGTQTNVTVPLLRATSPGQRYQVLLYADDGDRLFDLHKDTLVMNADGSVVGTTFTAN